jgi:hypothetical protein
MQQLADRPRATRYNLEAEVVYRRIGEGSWCEGRTLNVSRSGVLFRSSAPVLPEATRVEFILLLPSLGLPGRSRVQCQGKIVRHCIRQEDGGCAMAATIDAYDFLGSAPEAPAKTSLVV